MTSVTCPLSAVPSWPCKSRTNLIWSISCYDNNRLSSFSLSSWMRCAFNFLTNMSLSASTYWAFKSKLSLMMFWTCLWLLTYEYVVFSFTEESLLSRASFGGPRPPPS